MITNIAIRSWLRVIGLVVLVAVVSSALSVWLVQRTPCEIVAYISYPDGPLGAAQLYLAGAPSLKIEMDKMIEFTVGHQTHEVRDLAGGQRK